MYRTIAVIAALAVLAGCDDTWTTSNLDRNTQAKQITTTDVAAVRLSSKPFDARRSENLGVLKVEVNKTTVFNPDPTVEAVEEKLRIEAAKLGATEVVQVEIGDVKVSTFSWGTRKGTGIATKPK